MFLSLLVVVATLSRPLGADVLITARVVGKAGGRDVSVTRSTAIKGVHMRIDVVQAGESTSTIYDLRDGVIIALDARKKRAELRDIAARSAKVSRHYPRARVTTTLKATQAVKDIAGATCTEHTYVIRLPMTKDFAFMLTGSAWIAAEAPGAADYGAFARAAVDRDVVLGAADNSILLAVARAQSELYRALADLGGIPYVIDMTMAIDGKGMLAGIVRKGVSGTRASTVTAVSVAPLDDSTFAVPAGWKRERK